MGCSLLAPRGYKHTFLPRVPLPSLIIEDFTPVCTTELGAFAKLESEFTKRGVKLIGLSANTIESHGLWIKDIDEVSGCNLKFPIIGDKERKIAHAYDMFVPQ